MKSEPTHTTAYVPQYPKLSEAEKEHLLDTIGEDLASGAVRHKDWDGRKIPLGLNPAEPDPAKASAP
jgi:hypothetical protein